MPLCADPRRKICRFWWVDHHWLLSPEVRHVPVGSGARSAVPHHKVIHGSRVNQGQQLVPIYVNLQAHCIAGGNFRHRIQWNYQLCSFFNRCPAFRHLCGSQFVEGPCWIPLHCGIRCSVASRCSGSSHCCEAVHWSPTSCTTLLAVLLLICTC